MIKLFALVFFALANFFYPVVNAVPVVAGNTQPSHYPWDTLTEGSAVYIDRNYTYTKIPSAYAGAQVLRTANDDKRATSERFLSFDVNQPVTVSVAHDVRITEKPSWLSGWTATGEKLLTSDTTLEVFRRDFPAGSVTLGGNAGPSNSSMYTLLVAAAPAPEAPPEAPEEPEGPDDTPEQPTPVDPLQLSDTAPAHYPWDTLTEGSAVYIDRNYAYTKIPSAYAGAQVLRTANDDKRATSERFLSFDVNQPVTVSVAHDVRITEKPSWLSGWTATGEKLLTSDTTLEVFRRDFPAGTVTLGGNGGPSASSMYTLFIATAPAPDTPEEPEGPDDTPEQPTPVVTKPGEPVVIKPWEGDRPASLEIVSSPGHGQVHVNDDRTLTYEPNGDFNGTDVFSYKLKMSDGSIALRSATIVVACEDCSSDTIFNVSWDPNAEADKVQGYRVYVGATASDATTKVADLSIAAADFDASAPEAKFNASDDLISGIPGETVCFRITAYNEVGVSDYSEPACSKL